MAPSILAEDLDLAPGLQWILSHVLGPVENGHSVRRARRVGDGVGRGKGESGETQEEGMKMNIQTLLVTIEVVTCGHTGCGVVFGFESNFVSARKKDHAIWYCPNGHERYWPAKSNEEILQEKLALAEREKRWEEDSKKRAWAAHSAAMKRLASAKGSVTKIKNRVSNGVCPCCKRSFSNLAAHMRHLHPSWKKSE